MEIEVGGDFEKALQTFTRQIRSSGLFREVKVKEFYRTRTQRRKEKDKLAERRKKKKETSER